MSFQDKTLVEQLREATRNWKKKHKNFNKFKVWRKKARKNKGIAIENIQ